MYQLLEECSVCDRCVDNQPTTENALNCRDTCGLCPLFVELDLCPEARTATAVGLYETCETAEQRQACIDYANTKE